MRKILGGLMLLGSVLGLVQCGGADAGPTSEDIHDSSSGSVVGEGIKADSVSSISSSIEYPGVVAVDAGFAGNGTTIAVPDGFTADQCRFTAAASNVAGSSISTTVSINSTTGEVICQKVVQEREEVPPETQDCVAAYTVTCVKSAESLLLKSSGGTCYRVTVTDAGALGTSATTCP